MPLPSPILRRACIAASVVVTVLSSTPPLAATTVRDLVARADRLCEADISLEALQEAVTLYQQALQREPGRADIQVKLAATALRVGEESATDALSWYEMGEQAAGRALVIDEGNAEAHFLLAAHRGQLAKRRLVVAPSIVGELEEHLLRSLALNPRQPMALHMMAVLLRDTPLLLRGYLKGSRSEVHRYLAAAVDADPNFAPARLDLATYYRSAGRISAARAQAQAVLDMTRPTHIRPWREKYRPAAEAFLKDLPSE